MAHTTCCSIAPPDLLARLIEEGEPEQRSAAVETMAASASIRTQRTFVARIAQELGADVRTIGFMQEPETTGVRQTVYDVENGGRSRLPGRRARGADDPAVGDPAVDDVHEATERTYEFFSEVFDRDSVDGQGMELISTVHYSTNFDNAFWNGAQMVYGDGSGRIFNVGALTSAVDVIAHELTHALTQFTAKLEYSSQPGALNESFSDVFGSLVKQFVLGQTVEEADWLIGPGALVPTLGTALRSMKEPGTAHSGDRQPAHMDDYVDLPDDGDPANDNGGVHINSSIKNRAFYLAASKLGGHAWERAGKIWFETLTGNRLTPTASFEEAAQATLAAAGDLFGDGEEREAVEYGWREVGVL